MPIISPVAADPAPPAPSTPTSWSLGQHGCADSDKLFLWPVATALSKSWQWPQSVAGWPITVQKCNFTFSINKHLATDSGHVYSKSGGRIGRTREPGAVGPEASRVVYFTFAAAKFGKSLTAEQRAVKRWPQYATRITFKDFLRRSVGSPNGNPTLKCSNKGGAEKYFRVWKENCYFVTQNGVDS